MPYSAALAPALRGAYASSKLNLMNGQSIAHYKVLKEIGAGGMGRVYLAEDTKLGRRVAIKLLLAAAPDELQVARFHREARATAALNHPNIVSIHEMGLDGDTPYVVMEWLDGQTLRQHLAGGALRLDAALAWTRELVAGVAAAHDRGICHRDLKPENVFITADRRVKVLDFGLAQMRSDGARRDQDDVATASVLTGPGVVLGTYAYMAPEQVRGESADLRSDVFAVGLMLFELLTGTRPFRGGSPVETMHAILTHPTPLERLHGTVPPAVVSVVERCLAKRAVDRFASARELATALAALEGSTPPVAAASTATAAPIASTRPSIAVLPFTNLSGDAEMEYFSDGVTEEVINAIGQVKGLHVAARTSSFSFKGRTVSIQEVGAALNVTAVLEGSVRRSGQRLRITTQLIDVATGYHTWAERYDRQLDDVFAIQEDIAANIMRKLEVAFRTSALARPAASIDAYDLYLKGRYLVEQRGDGLVKGLEFFKQAIAVDPTYAVAYAGLAETLTVLAIYALAPHGTVLPEAGAAAAKALQLDPRLAEAHNAMAMVAVFRDWDWAKACAEFDQALELNPNLVEARFWKGLLYHQLSQGNMTEAIEDASRAVALDPLGMLPVYALAMVLLNAGQPAAAIVRCEERLDASPSQFLLYRVLGVACLCVGRGADAIAALERGTELSRRHTWFVSELGAAYAINGRPADAERLQEELLARASLSWISPITLAAIPLALGRVDEAVALFERAFAEHDPVLLTTTAWPLFSLVRKEIRVQRLFADMHVRWTA